MKIYLDDIREPPIGWKLVHWPDEAIELLKTGQVTHISLDHDLGDDKKGTGYDVILWMEEAVAISNFKLPKYISIHSANPVGKERMQRALDRICNLN